MMEDQLASRLLFPVSDESRRMMRERNVREMALARVTEYSFWSNQRAVLSLFCRGCVDECGGVPLETHRICIEF